VYTNDIHGLYVLQLLEFHWNTTYIGTMLPRWWIHQRIFITYHLDQWKLSLATYHQDGFFITLSLHVNAMIVIENYMFCTVNNLFW